MRFTRMVVLAALIAGGMALAPANVHAQTPCDPLPCTYISDIDGNGFTDATDLAFEIDAVFFGGSLSRYLGSDDIDGNGFVDATDLAFLIDMVFFGAPLEFPYRQYVLKGRLGTGSWSLLCDTSDIQYVFGDASNNVFNVGEDLTYAELDCQNCPKTDTLNIPAGVVIFGYSGAEPGSFIIRRSGYVHAVGTAQAPIVLTSPFAPGTRARSDWGGMVINGCACNNNSANPIVPYVFETEGANAGIGGGTCDTDNSGCYSYLRVEFAGDQLFLDNELNGITLTSVGSGTTLDHIQINQNFDDGIEWFGGTVNIHHSVVSGVGDDGFDSDYGARWKGQYLIVIQDPITGPTTDNHNGFEWDNQAEAPYQSAPRMKPTIWNATLVGADCALVLARQNGAHLRRGADANINNSIWTKFRRALEYDDVTAWDNITWGPNCHDVTAQANPDARIEILNSIWYQIGDSSGNASVTSERPYLQDPTNVAEFGCAVPEILVQVDDYAQVGGPLDFRPIAGDPQGIGINLPGSVPPIDGFFDPAGAAFKGAVSELDPSPWYSGWTSFAID
ncbi:MAG: hypothetical protein AB1752_05860 [Candidatus Zixiibacteriota bacterium]